MEVVEAGYKMTEVGMIPEDWTVTNFKSICYVNQGLQIAIHNRLNKPQPNSKIYITIQYLNDGKDIEYINEYSDSVCCDIDDVLMTRTGNTGIIVTDVKGVFHNNFFKINFDRHRIDKKYLVYFLNQESTQKRILQKAGTSTIPDLNHNDFYSLLIYFPSLQEQKAIATALSDVDALITSLDKLIEKKKAIKLGAMQELLTPPDQGGKRLEGFSGDWDWISLGQLAKITMGQSPSSSNYNSEGIGLPLVQGNADIQDRRTIIRNYTSQITKTGRKGDIIMSVRAPVGEVAKAAFDCCLGRGVCSISYDNEFLYQYLLLIEPNWSKFSTGSTFDSINSNQLASIQIPIPKDSKEQMAIAKVLSDMDSEVHELENKRDKYNQIKQGMMQELLTGKTRLI